MVAPTGDAARCVGRREENGHLRHLEDVGEERRLTTLPRLDEWARLHAGLCIHYANSFCSGKGKSGQCNADGIRGRAVTHYAYGQLVPASIARRSLGGVPRVPSRKKPKAEQHPFGSRSSFASIYTRDGSLLDLTPPCFSVAKAPSTFRHVALCRRSCIRDFSRRARRARRRSMFTSENWDPRSRFPFRLRCAGVARRPCGRTGVRHSSPVAPRRPRDTRPARRSGTAFHTRIPTQPRAAAAIRNQTQSGSRRRIGCKRADDDRRRQGPSTRRVCEKPLS